MHKVIINISLFLMLAATCAEAGTAGVHELKSLDPCSNKTLKSLRNDVRKSIYVIKSGRPEHELPDLKFYSYRVQKNDTFWTILARSSQDIDTLLSVNNLSTPRDITPGKKIYIPNMRGIVMKGDEAGEIRKLLASNRIRPEYVQRANRCRNFEKEYIFVPGGKISNLERSLFLGTGFLYPLPRKSTPRLTSNFGMRRNPFDQRYMEFHSGVDIACPRGSDILAARNGRVVFTGYRDGYGKLVVIEHEHGYRSYYGHLSRPLVKRGQRVKRGEAVALSGNTGRTTGPHLHFEVRRGGTAVHPGVLLKD